MSEPFQVYAEPDTSLHTMLSALDAAELEEKAAKDRVKTLKDGIKAELTAMTNGDGTPHLLYRLSTMLSTVTPRVLRWTPSTRIDTPKLKAERPDIYAAYSKASGAWVLAVAK